MLKSTTFSCVIQKSYPIPHLANGTHLHGAAVPDRLGSQLKKVLLVSTCFVKTKVDFGMTESQTSHEDLPMVLNFDVLLTVMSHLQGSELLPVMQSCRDLYTGGIPHLLRLPVVLRSRARILSFCYFILIEPSRFQYLRSLEIRAPGRFQAGPKADLFLAMLMHATHLEEFKVLDCEILLSDERIPAAVAALTSLKSVSFPALNLAATSILATSQSPINKVEIGFWSDDAVGPDDPVPLLTLFTHSLRELRVTYAEFGRQDIQYPYLDVLVVDDCRFAQVQPLIKSFPNVRDLSLWTGQEDEDLEADEVDEHRQMNISAQEEHTWDRLEFLRGDIRSLYLLGVTSHVPHLDVHSAFLTPARANELAALLITNRPSTLSVRVKVWELDKHVFTEVLRPVNQSLTRLVLYLNFCSTVHRTSIPSGQILDCLSATLAHTSIADLVLHLCWDDITVDLLSGHDLDGFSAAVLERVPSLRRLLLVDPYERLLTSWESKPDRNPQKLDDAGAFAMLAEGDSQLQ
ncbi:hypothetical protein NM688_g5674 [Phlebia brevispora]|uniref:Uncharacterized protein n=1 Tax=Phlebia brevispora TaxID=194682 RepID=A0ACC1SRJ2_9APHY|nr:hypothetical protein NM688_g5674 [Phlebia brevispora]